MNIAQCLFAGDWDFDKNGDLSPEVITHGSHRSIWWKCRNGHSWMARPLDRSKGNGCPYCSGRLITRDKSLGFLYPRLSEQICDKNIDVFSLHPGSYTSLKWMCDSGHMWSSAPRSRTRHGSGCPFCSGRLATPENNLSVSHPDLIVEWDIEKNMPLQFCDIKKGTSKKVWWKCVKGHSWFMSPHARTGQNQGCPYCSRRRAGQGNTLNDLCPDIVGLWDGVKNKTMTPDDVVVSSQKKVWWKCDKGHSLFRRVCDVVISGGCMYCLSSRFVSSSCNLALDRPDVASEWHPLMIGLILWIL